METATETVSAAAPEAPQAEPDAVDAAVRLLDKQELGREAGRRIRALVKENKRLRGDLHFRDEQIAQLKAQVVMPQEQPDPDAIVKVMAEGERLFPDWKMLLSEMYPGEEIVAALGRCEHGGAAALYMLCTGALILHSRGQRLQAQRQIESLESHYQEIRAQHFEKTPQGTGA